MQIIYVKSTSDLPKQGKLLTELPTKGNADVYVYEGQTMRLKDSDPKEPNNLRPWTVIVRAER